MFNPFMPRKRLLGGFFNFLRKNVQKHTCGHKWVNEKHRPTSVTTGFNEGL